MNLERLKAYAGQVVTVQMKAPVFMLTFNTGSGTALTAAVARNPENPSEVAAIGFAQMMLDVVIEVRETHVVLKHTDPPTGAKLEIDVPPDAILYIWRVAEPPSQLITP